MCACSRELSILVYPVPSTGISLLRPHPIKIAQELVGLRRGTVAAERGGGFGGGSRHDASEAEPPLVLGLDRREIANLSARRAAPPPPSIVVALRAAD